MTIYQNDQPIAEDAVKDYRSIHAAGGIVCNENNEILMIFRLGKWDFPKGKVEEGELYDQTAVREVEEETGIQNIVLGEPLPSTFHTYPLHGENILKETHWYKMTASSQSLTPQTIEDISQAVWISLAQVSEKLEDSYATLKELWGNYLQTL